MIDIFADEKEQPCLYIADIKIRVVYPTKKGSKKMEELTINLDRSPVVLLKGEFPTNRTRENFLRRIHERSLKNKKYEDVRYSVLDISNIAFSSTLAYKFDYEIH
jgi:hypothetical protein